MTLYYQTNHHVNFIFKQSSYHVFKQEIIKLSYHHLSRKSNKSSYHLLNKESINHHIIFIFKQNITDKKSCTKVMLKGGS